MLKLARTDVACSRSIHGSAGFTLVEMIVVLVLLAALIGVASNVIIDAVGSSQRIAGTEVAAQRAAHTMDRLGADLRSAISPDRMGENLPSNDALRAYLLNNANLAGLDLRDIALATPTALWVRTNAISEPEFTEPVAECVGYFTDAQGALVREVFADWRVCPGTGNPVDRRVMLGRLPQGAPSRPIFSYQTAMNSDPLQVPIDPRDCETAIVTTPTARQTDQIVRVLVDLRSYDATALGAGELKLMGSLDLRLRLAHDYLYGLGCSF